MQTIEKVGGQSSLEPCSMHPDWSVPRGSGRREAEGRSRRDGTMKSSLKNLEFFLKSREIPEH